MKYYIIAGEASGDLHGSNLMKALKEKDPQAQFRVWGGDRMAAEDGRLVKHFKDLAFMGFIEVIMNLRTILGNLRFCKRDLDAYQPDVLILIDYPGFNLRMAEYAHLKGYKVIYYISPQIWAWKQSRVHKIKRTVDRMLCILPFEKDFYAGFNYEVDFVGHPLIDAIDGRVEFDPEQRKEELGLSDKPVIAVLPGSRQQEIKIMLPIMLKAATKKEEYQVVIAAAPSQDRGFYEEIIGNYQVSIVEGKTYDLLEISEAALVTSGTATLETALFKVPEVVCYKGSWMSYWIARQLVKVNYISLVNLIMDKEVVTELIQIDMNPGRIEKELDRCLKGDHRDKLLHQYSELIEKLGGTGASAQAAGIISEELGL